MAKFPQAVLDQCAANIRKVADKYGCSTRQIIRGANPQSDNPDESCRIFNFVVIGKPTLGLALHPVEVSYLKARVFVGQNNAGGLEEFIESPEADNWPLLRELLTVDSPENLDHFDRIIGILGAPLSTDREARIAQWRQAPESIQAALAELQAEYDPRQYPTPAIIEKYMAKEDVVIINTDDLPKA